MIKPRTTLFMLMSVDGKISTGNTDKLDVDKDFPKINGVKEGLQQYYDVEKTTDIFSMISGRVLAKIGANNKQKSLFKLPVSFLIIDNKPHLNKTGVENFLKKSKKLFIITTNKKHPAYLRKDAANLKIIFYKNKITFEDLFKRLRKDFGIKRLTIQTGGTLNSILLRKKIIDKLSVVVAPVLIGGSDTSTLVDGKSLSSLKELVNVKALKLTKVRKLKNSYIHLKYDIINDTKIL